MNWQNSGCGCGNNICTCSSCYPTNCPNISTAIYVQNSWNIPACGQGTTLTVQRLQTILVGGNLWSPTYGYFRVTSFNALTGQVQIVNDCVAGNMDPGTIVPANTLFAVTDIPASNSEWITPENSSWSYSTANEVNVPSNANNTYMKGDKVRFKQGGGYKYFYITDIGSTSLQLNAGIDYSVSNSLISDIAYSRWVNPYGFPGNFNYTPTFT
jgi:hypothetical protein